LCQATANSLVILDEVGRGTSTFDGLAIAQAVIEYIYSKIKARCLFATHYHELTHLEEHCSGIVNYHMQCKKSENGIIFLHKIAKGSSYGSFGIDVAKLADLPSEVISRAKKILKTLDVVSKKHERQLFQAAKRMENDDSDYVRHLKQELENKNQILKSIERN